MIDYKNKFRITNNFQILENASKFTPEKIDPSVMFEVNSIFLQLNCQEDVIFNLDKLNNLIDKHNIYFSADASLIPVLNLIFIIYSSTDGKMHQLAFHTLVLILRNSMADENAGLFYFQNNFHILLFNDFSASEELLPNLLLEAIHLYSSTCQNARDSILNTFHIDFFFNLVRNNSCLKQILHIFIVFLKFPFAVEILSCFFHIISEVVTKDDVEIILLTLYCISTSVRQEGWIHCLCEYNNILKFLKMCLTKDINFRECSIEIFDHLSKAIPLSNSVLHDIINVFLDNDSILTVHFAICAANIFCNHMKREDKREELLKIGMINFILILVEDGSFEIKQKAFMLIVELIKYGNYEQRSKILYYDNILISFIFSILHSSSDELILDSLQALNVLLQDYIIAGNFQEFINIFHNLEGIEMVTELKYFQNTQISSASQAFLSILTHASTSDDKL